MFFRRGGRNKKLTRAKPPRRKGFFFAALRLCAKTKNKCRKAGKSPRVLDHSLRHVRRAERSKK
jgi:hypothetical protein